jgi:hypothetical protein
MTDGTQTQWLDISSANGQAAAAAAGGGAMELISTTNVAANALNVSITGLTGYSSYKLIINNLVLTGTNASQYILLQTMSGGSVSPAGSVYTSTTHYGANWTLHNGVASGHQMMYNPGTQGRVSVDISNLNQGAPTMFSSVGSNLPYGESRFATQVSSGIENSTGTRDGLYLYLSHYNFGAGTDISLYGIKDS